MDAIIVVDMQVGLLDDAPKHDLPAVLDRIDALAAMVARSVSQRPMNCLPRLAPMLGPIVRHERVDRRAPITFMPFAKTGLVADDRY